MRLPAMPSPRRQLFSLTASLFAISLLIGLSPILSGGARVLAASRIPGVAPHWVWLNGSVAPLTRSARRLQPLERTRRLGVTVALAPRDPAGLAQFLSEEIGRAHV